VLDLQAEAEEFPEGSAFAKRFGHRTTLAVPLLREGAAVGTIMLRRAVVNPFTDRQIALLKTFADQAVIAIENTRLLNELRESLQQQTATAEVLKVISGSPGALTPVFDAMLQNAVSICEAKFGVMFRFDGDLAYAVAMLNLPPALDEYLRQRGRRQPAPGSDLEKVFKSKQVIHTIDSSETPNPIPPARLAGARTCITVPMLKETELVGAIVIYRQDVRPLHRQANRAGDKLRCPGGDRDRECAPAQRAARIASAADRDLGGVAGHLEFARRTGAGVPGDAGECHSHL
jgi:GAF domain-containing protein